MGVPISVLDRSKMRDLSQFREKHIKSSLNNKKIQNSSSSPPHPQHRQPFPAVISNVIMHHSPWVGLEARRVGDLVRQLIKLPVHVSVDAKKKKQVIM